MVAAAMPAMHPLGTHSIQNDGPTHTCPQGKAVMSHFVHFKMGYFEF